jgi:hypothetical protein
MRQQTVLNLIKGDKVNPKTDYRDALPVNMYAVARPILGASGYMIQQQGLTLLGNGAGIDRGGAWNDNFQMHFRVSGGRLLSLLEDGTTQDLGPISGTATAVLDYSFNTQAVVADGKFWLYDPAGGFRQVTDSDLGQPIDFCWIDGYYFFTDGKFIYHTDITDEASIDPLKFATAEFIPDQTLGVHKTEDNKVMVFGRYSIEYFVNQASANFAFTRVPARALKIGIVGTNAKCEVGGKVYILGGRVEEAVSFHVVGVGSAQKLGNREIDQILATYTEQQLQDAVLESFESDGTNFALIHLPNHVLMFNETIAGVAGIDQAWSIWQSDVLGSTPCRAKHAVFDQRLNKWVFGDKQNTNIGILDASVATQYGEIVEWLLFTPFVYLEDQSIDELEIETIPGFTQFDDATVFVSMTYNGITYGLEWTQMYGLPAQYSSRFIVRRLGYIDNWVGMKLRGASRSRMAFGLGKITHG